MFLWNISLALIWAAVTGRFDLTNVLVGMALGYAVLFIAQPIMGPSSYSRRVQRTVGFALFYVRELILANLRVAADVLSPRPRIRPGVLAIPLDAATDTEITLLANLL